MFKMRAISPCTVAALCITGAHFENVDFEGGGRVRRTPRLSRVLGLVVGWEPSRRGQPLSSGATLVIGCNPSRRVQL